MPHFLQSRVQFGCKLDLDLINLIRTFPEIYNKKKYLFVDKRVKAWKIISEKLNLDVEKCKQRWMVILTTYKKKKFKNHTFRRNHYINKIFENGCLDFLDEYYNVNEKNKEKGYEDYGDFGDVHNYTVKIVIDDEDDYEDEDDNEDEDDDEYDDGMNNKVMPNDYVIVSEVKNEEQDVVKNKLSKCLYDKNEVNKNKYSDLDHMISCENIIESHECPGIRDSILQECKLEYDIVENIIETPTNAKLNQEDLKKDNILLSKESSKAKGVTDVCEDNYLYNNFKDNSYGSKISTSKDFSCNNLSLTSVQTIIEMSVNKMLVNSSTSRVSKALENNINTPSLLDPRPDIHKAKLDHPKPIVRVVDIKKYPPTLSVAENEEYPIITKVTSLVGSNREIMEHNIEDFKEDVIKVETLSITDSDNNSDSLHTDAAIVGCQDKSVQCNMACSEDTIEFFKFMGEYVSAKFSDAQQQKIRKMITAVAMAIEHE